METAVWVPSPENPGCIVRERNLTHGQVAKEIAEAVEKAGLVDEYVSTWPGRYSFAPPGDQAMPSEYRWVVYAVEGGSEGHYVHVAYKTVVYQRHEESKLVELVLVKTFGGWDKAMEIASFLTRYVHE